jgi:enoyl-[acyl-carrier protein] reductase II
VVAAGGIADARGVLAALALGACGVQIGTRFITTEESEAPAWVKEKVLQARETDTIVTSLLTGKPVRTLATQGIRDYEQALRNGAGEEKLKALRARVRSAEDGERVAVAGQIAGLITSVTTVANLIQELVEGVSEVYTGLRATVSPGQRSAAGTPPAGRNALRNG